jgi:hypothetical protein
MSLAWHETQGRPYGKDQALEEPILMKGSTSNRSNSKEGSNLKDQTVATSREFISGLDIEP